MDKNADSEKYESEFGIHLDHLAEEEASDNQSMPESTGGNEAQFEESAIIEPADEKEELGVAFQKTTSDDTDQILWAIDGIKRQLEDLTDTFESKLKYDDHKNKVIDELHQSLQDYRDGLLKKYLQRIFTDVIKIVDDVRKLAAHYREQPFSEENSAKLLQYLEDMARDLEDMFSWEGVEAFNSEGDLLDPARQRVVSKIETDDPSKDKTIAQRLRPGYEWDGKIIRPEIVSIFTYNVESSPDEKEI